MLDEHIQWALEKQNQQLPNAVQTALSTISPQESVNKIEARKSDLFEL